MQNLLEYLASEGGKVHSSYVYARFSQEEISKYVLDLKIVKIEEKYGWKYFTLTKEGYKMLKEKKA